MINNFRLSNIGAAHESCLHAAHCGSFCEFTEEKRMSGQKDENRREREKQRGDNRATE